MSGLTLVTRARRMVNGAQRLGLSCAMVAAIVHLVLAIDAAAEPPITAAAFAPDGQSIVVGSQRGLAVYRWPQLTVLQRLETKLAHTHDLAFSPDGQTLAAAGGAPAEAGGLERFAWPEGELLDQQTIGDDLLYRVAWHPDGQTLVAAGPNHGMALFDTTTNKFDRIEGHSRAVLAVACLPDAHLVSASRDNTIRVWSHPTRELVRTLNNHTAAVHDIDVRPGGLAAPWVLASASEDRTVRFWWPVRGRLMRFARLPSPALDIQWTPDGALLVAVCADGHLRTIDPDSVQITRDVSITANWLYTLAIDQDGKQAFVGGAGGLMQVVELR